MSNDGETTAGIIGTENLKLALADVICNFQPVGITELTISGMKIHPNPMSDFLEVDMQEEGIYQVTLKNMMGNILSEAVISGNRIRIHTENLLAGVYVIQVRSENGKYYSELAIKN